MYAGPAALPGTYVDNDRLQPSNIVMADLFFLPMELPDNTVATVPILLRGFFTIAVTSGARCSRIS